MSWCVVKRENKDSVCYGPYGLFEAQRVCEKIVQSEIPDCKTSNIYFDQERMFELPGGIGEFTLQMVQMKEFTG